MRQVPLYIHRKVVRALSSVTIAGTVNRGDDETLSSPPNTVTHAVKRAFGYAQRWLGQLAVAWLALQGVDWPWCWNVIQIRWQAIIGLGWVAAATAAMTGIDKFGVFLDGITHSHHPALVVVFTENQLIMAHVAHRMWWITFMAIAVPRSMIAWPISYFAGKQAHRFDIRWRWWLWLKRRVTHVRNVLLWPLRYSCLFLVRLLPESSRLRRLQEKHEVFFGVFLTYLAVCASTFAPFVGYPALGFAGARSLADDDNAKYYNWQHIACVMLVAKVAKAYMYIKMGEHLDLFVLARHLV